MASSKLMMKMSSSPTRNSDLIRRKSSNSSSSSTSANHHHHHLHHFNLNHNYNHDRKPGSVIGNNNPGVVPMTVDDLLRNIRNDSNNERRTSESNLLDAEISLLDAAGAVSAINGADNAATISRQGSVRTSSNGGQKTVDDVWKEIIAGRTCKQEVPDEMMTLEDFLAKAEAVEEEDVKIPPPPLPTQRLSGGIFSFENPVPPPNVDGGVVGYGIGAEDVAGRGKRRAILEPLDKAAQQRQRRMIKNRESAARSRERKQAYQAELESLAVKLEEENEMLLKEKAERTRKRYKQLMENIIPVTEKPRPTTRVLKRVRSMEW